MKYLEKYYIVKAEISCLIHELCYMDDLVNVVLLSLYILVKTFFYELVTVKLTLD